MVDQFNPNSTREAGSAYAEQVVTFDAGLRAYMIRIYNTVAAGLAISGVVAYGIYSVPALFGIFMNPMVSIGLGVFMIAFLWFGMNPNKMMRQSAASVQSKYYLFTALMGASLCYVFAIYSGQAITRVFFITSAMFAGTSLLGYTTKRDLTGMGSFLMMGLIGIIIASLVNIFLKSTGMTFVISIVSVLVFTGLIAYETQNAKRLYNASNGDETNQKLATISAVNLYLDFINLFLTLLRLFGNRN